MPDFVVDLVEEHVHLGGFQFSESILERLCSAHASQQNVVVLKFRSPCPPRSPLFSNVLNRHCLQRVASIYHARFTKDELGCFRRETPPNLSTRQASLGHLAQQTRGMSPLCFARPRWWCLWATGHRLPSNTPTTPKSMSRTKTFVLTLAPAFRQFIREPSATQDACHLNTRRGDVSARTGVRTPGRRIEVDPKQPMTQEEQPRALQIFFLEKLVQEMFNRGCPRSWCLIGKAATLHRPPTRLPQGRPTEPSWRASHPTGKNPPGSSRSTQSCNGSTTPGA